MKHPCTRTFYSIPLLLLILAAVIGSCKKDEFNTSPDLRLRFSTDSVMFDTVFTTVGSATQFLKVYNNDDSFVKIGSIKLKNDPNNSYRINVDGLSGTGFEDIEIGPEDSLFIFIEVTVEPNADALYPFVEGEIEFVTNGNAQTVDLVAWGWDAIFYTPTVFPESGIPDFTLIDTQDPQATVTWSAEKPVVVYGYLVVDSLQSLIVEPGANVYFHQGAGLWVYNGGNIKAEGTLEAPITFQGDRLEAFYDEQPGQWDRIWINEGPGDNIFRNVLIKNNFIGIQCETLPFAYNINAGLTAPDNRLILENVVIRNNSVAGILSKNYRIDGTNVLMSSGGEYLLAGTGAGQYNFDQSTFANNWRQSIRQTPAVFVTNLARVSPTQVLVGPVVNSRFRNCIIYGNSFNELELDLDTVTISRSEIDLEFMNCLLRGEEEVLQPYVSQGFITGSSFVNQEPGFIDFSEGNFMLAPDAFAIGKGAQNVGVVNDITGFMYAPVPPMGCFEFQPE